MTFTFVSIPDAAAEAVAVEGHRRQRLALYRMRRSRAGAPALLFGHACGFAAGAYLPLLERLCDVAEVFAFDARGHGGSQSQPDDLSLYGYDDFALDIAAVGRALAPRRVHFVGHSLCAAAMLRLACLHGEAFAATAWRSLVLFEPPVYPGAERPEHPGVVAADQLVRKRTRFRRRDWTSPEALAAALTGRGLFRNVAPAFLDAYARAGLRPAGDGFTLACTPEIEEAAFAGFATDTTYRALDALAYRGPLWLVGGDGSLPDAQWPTRLAPVIADRLGCGRRPDRRFIHWPGRSHLLVQEDPEQAAETLREMILKH